jgi:hypothetical protein
MANLPDVTGPQVRWPWVKVRKSKVTLTISLDYDGFQPAVRQWQGARQVFDPVRKRWVSLTPEEWVRQHLLFFLVQKCTYPSEAIAVEKTIQVGERTKRFDVLIYDALHRPWLAVECKSTDVRLDSAVLHQLLVYNQTLHVPYLAVVNGEQAVLFQIVDGQLASMVQFPAWG